MGGMNIIGDILYDTHTECTEMPTSLSKVFLFFGVIFILLAVCQIVLVQCSSSNSVEDIRHSHMRVLRSIMISVFGVRSILQILITVQVYNLPSWCSWTQPLNAGMASVVLGPMMICLYPFVSSGTAYDAFFYVSAHVVTILSVTGRNADYVTWMYQLSAVCVANALVIMSIRNQREGFCSQVSSDPQPHTQP